MNKAKDLDITSWFFDSLARWSRHLRNAIPFLLIVAVVGGGVMIDTYLQHEDALWVLPETLLQFKNFIVISAVAFFTLVCVVIGLWYPAIAEIGSVTGIVDRTTLDVGKLKGWRQFADVIFYMIAGLGIVTSLIISVIWPDFRWEMRVFWTGYVVALVFGIYDTFFIKYNGNLFEKLKNSSQVIVLLDSTGVSRNAALWSAFLYLLMGRAFALLCTFIPLLFVTNFVQIYSKEWSTPFAVSALSTFVLLLMLAYGVRNLRGTMISMGGILLIIILGIKIAPDGEIMEHFIRGEHMGATDVYARCISENCSTAMQTIDAHDAALATSEPSSCDEKTNSYLVREVLAVDDAYALARTDNHAIGVWLKSDEVLLCPVKAIKQSSSSKAVSPQK